jgi:crotonobetainyl-CoA:carnitine CoA-transferase CaiB-like acyl-CoA transferase
MVDAALNVAAEQVIEHSAYGALLERQGNRGPTAAPQNLYRVAKRDESARDDSWVAIAVATNEHWRALRAALGEPAWAADEDLETAAGRLRAQDEIDARLAEWCRGRQSNEVVSRLSEAGVPVAAVTQPHHQPDLPPFQARHFFEEVKHPVIGNSRYSTLPIRFERGPDRWHTRHAPLLGEHNRELLRELGLTSEDVDALEAEGVIGESLVAGA